MAGLPQYTELTDCPGRPVHGDKLAQKKLVVDLDGLPAFAAVFARQKTVVRRDPAAIRAVEKNGGERRSHRAGLRRPCDSAVAAAQDLPVESHGPAVVRIAEVHRGQRPLRRIAPHLLPGLAAIRGAENHAGPADHPAALRVQEEDVLERFLGAGGLRGPGEAPVRRVKNDSVVPGHPARLADELNGRQVLGDARLPRLPCLAAIGRGNQQPLIADRKTVVGIGEFDIPQMPLRASVTFGPGRSSIGGDHQTALFAEKVDQRLSRRNPVAQPATV